MAESVKWGSTEQLNQVNSMERNSYILRLLRASDEHRKVLYRDENRFPYFDRE